MRCNYFLKQFPNIRFPDKIERTSIKILLDILNELGGWPVISGESWNDSTFEWESLIYKLRRIGYQNSIHSFVTFTTEVDEKNNTKYVVKVSEIKTVSFD